MATVILPASTIATQRPSSPVSPTIYDNSQRQSFVSSSGTSFFTAKASPLTPATPNPLTAPTSSSSADTLSAPPNRQGEQVTNSTGKQVLHSEEHRFVQVASETVTFQTGSGSPPAVSSSNKVMQYAQSSCVKTHVTTGGAGPAGPPPPSPPASVDQEEPPDIPTHLRRKPDSSHQHHVNGIRDRASSDSRDTQRLVSTPSFPVSPSEQYSGPQRSSTDTMRLSSFGSRSGALTVSTRAPRISAQSDGSAAVDIHISEISTSPTAKAAPQSPDGFLQPPQSQSIPGRSTRRSTTIGSGVRTVRSAPQPGTTYDDDGDDIEDDIQLHAEQIRRERKRKAEVEAAMTRKTSARRGSWGTKEDENRPRMGNLIGEDHVNYVLMYNMLTGIRIAVSPILFPELQWLMCDYQGIEVSSKDQTTAH